MCSLGMFFSPVLMQDIPVISYSLDNLLPADFPAVAVLGEATSRFSYLCADYVQTRLL